MSNKKTISSAYGYIMNRPAKYWLVLIALNDNGTKTENILQNTNNLEALGSVISFYSSCVNETTHLQVWEAITYDPFGAPDKYKVIKEVKRNA